MKRITSRLVARLLGILLLLIWASLILSNAVAAQMQPWSQQEQMRQMYERQQLLQQEWAKQSADRQQLLMWQQQQQARQAADRQQLLMWQQQERQRRLYQR